MDYVLGVDLGTSYFKLGLLNKQGDLCGFSRIFVPKDTGDGTRSEVPVDRFWQVLKKGLQEACVQAQTTPSRIKAVAYSSQANSFVLLDKNKKPLTPIILWCDNRAENADLCKDVFNNDGFLDITGLGIGCSHQFCISKLLWFQQLQPELWSQVDHVMTISDYFTYCMTGQTVGDASTASLLGLLNIHTLQWQKDFFPFEHIHLSTPLRPGTCAGAVVKNGTELFGLPPDIPFVVGSLDHLMGAVGAGAGSIADMSESTGTVLACLKLSSHYHPLENTSTGPGFTENQYYQLAFNDNGAVGLEWYQNKFSDKETFHQFVQSARDINVGSNGLVAKPGFHLYKGMEGFDNYSPLHEKGHFTRAILELTALSLFQLVNILSPGSLPQRIAATGGGAKSEIWLQIKADLLGIEFITTQAQAPACMGAAMYASLAAGWFADIEAVSVKWIKIKNIFKPIERNHEKYQEWYNAVTSNQV